MIESAARDSLIARPNAYHHEKAAKRLRGHAPAREISTCTLVCTCPEGAVSHLFAHLRETFPHADQAGKFTVFDIGGNKVRLIAAVQYNRRKIYIRYVLTHEEYDRGKWKR